MACECNVKTYDMSRKFSPDSWNDYVITPKILLDKICLFRPEISIAGGCKMFFEHWQQEFDVNT